MVSSVAGADPTGWSRSGTGCPSSRPSGPAVRGSSFSITSTPRCGRWSCRRGWLRSGPSSNGRWRPPSTGAAGSSPCRRRHGRRSSPCWDCRRERVSVVPPGVDPRFSPGGADVGRAVGGGRRSTGAGEAFRSPHRRTRLGEAETSPACGPRSSVRAMNDRRSRPGSRPPAPATGSARRAAVRGGTARGLPPGLGTGEHLPARRLGDDHHRSGRLRDAGGGDPDRRPPRRRRGRGDRNPGRPARASSVPPWKRSYGTSASGTTG